jgi:4-hydroxybenzoate polyprenyltransferase
MLGASAVPLSDIGGGTIWAMPQLAVAGGLGIYICGVTWFARQEAGQSRRLQLGGAMLVINAGLVLLIGFVLHWPDLLGRGWNTALALACIGVVFNRRLLVALGDPASGNVQAAIRTLLLSLIMLDGSLVFFVQEDRSLAILVVLLLVPATFLGRFLAIT